MGWDEVCAKFAECAGYGGLPPAAIRDVVAMVEDLDGLPDVRRLAGALAP